MNLTNLSHAYFILLICILNEIYGTRIPLEIVELESGTRISDVKIAANEYHTMDEIDSSSHDAGSTKQNKSNGNSKSNNVAGHDHNNEWHIRNREGIRKISAEPRILYQVGSSEEDLPICGTNEVCSKIDLYGTPWIERQCRCPQPKHHHTIDDMEKNHLLNTRNRHAILHNLRLGDIGHNMYDFERKNIKNFLIKLGMLHEMEEKSMNMDDYYYESDQDDYDYYAGDDRHDEHSVIHSNSLKSQHHKNSVNEAIEMVKMAKIRHHGHSTESNGHCSNSVHINDGHTIADKTRLYKVCEPVQKLPLCRYFRDYTWTLISYSDVNVTQQIVHCRCPRNSISYLIKREPLKNGAPGFTYLFACSPQSRLKCQRKEPCKLFTVRKRQEQLDEVNTNSLCQCPRNYRCPRLHTDAGVILGKSYIEDNIQTYSGYCMQDNQQ